MSIHTEAIQITPDNYKKIVSKTPFTVEVLDALKDTHPYLYVVKDPDGATYVMPAKHLVFFGYGDHGKTLWSDVYVK